MPAGQCRFSALLVEDGWADAHPWLVLLGLATFTGLLGDYLLAGVLGFFAIVFGNCLLQIHNLDAYWECAAIRTIAVQGHAKNRTLLPP